MKIDFYKYHGTGNDFILIDDRKGVFMAEKQLITKLCHRQFGIGADGIILLRDDDSLDFKMLYFNADGLEGSMCGNGGRCCVAFADLLFPGKDEVAFMAIDGKHKALIRYRNHADWTIKLSLRDVTSFSLAQQGYVMDTGSPHFVRFEETIDRIDIIKEGRKIRYHQDFEPAGINVNFVEVSGDSSISVRTYERGVEAETLSCGTGVTASAIAYALQTNRDHDSISVLTPGGKLFVEYTRTGNKFSDIWLEGPARLVYRGQLTGNR